MGFECFDIFKLPIGIDNNRLLNLKKKKFQAPY